MGNSVAALSLIAGAAGGLAALIGVLLCSRIEEWWRDRKRAQRWAAERAEWDRRAARAANPDKPPAARLARGR